MQKNYYKIELVIKNRATTFLEEKLGYFHDLRVNINLLEKLQKAQAIVFFVLCFKLEL